MARLIRIGLVGDYCPEVRAHLAIPRALEFAAELVDCEVEPTWLHTASIGESEQCAAFDGIWCVPNSPYANMAGALRAIRFARESQRPFLGTCGGFQHALIEYARNVIGLGDADHAESNPQAHMALIAPLSCSLVGAKGIIRLKPGSRAVRLYQAFEIAEEYHCNYGLNPKFQPLLDKSSLKISGTDQNGETRVVEMENHPFFMATLFQPELRALTGQAHPLIVEFVRASCSA